MIQVTNADDDDDGDDEDRLSARKSTQFRVGGQRTAAAQIVSVHSLQPHPIMFQHGLSRIQSSLMWLRTAFIKRT